MSAAIIQPAKPTAITTGPSQYEAMTTVPKNTPPQRAMKLSMPAAYHRAARRST